MTFGNKKEQELIYPQISSVVFADFFIKSKGKVAHFKKWTYLCRKNVVPMKSTTEYISILLANAEHLKSQFGIRSLRIFGSVSRSEQHDGSDIDICVDMPPKILLVSRLKRFLEQLVGCPVDIVRLHKHINPFLLDEINKDGIYIIR